MYADDYSDLHKYTHSTCMQRLQMSTNACGVIVNINIWSELRGRLIKLKSSLGSNFIINYSFGLFIKVQKILKQLHQSAKILQSLAIDNRHTAVLQYSPHTSVCLTYIFLNT